MVDLKEFKEYGLVEFEGSPVVSSRKVAEVFRRSHSHVLRDIEKLKGNIPEAIKSAWDSDFILSCYKSTGNKQYPEYLLTKDGFTLLAMGFNGRAAVKFKIMYIDRFNRMEQYIKSLSAARMEFPSFTGSIRSAHEKVLMSDFFDECNLINRIVIGMDAKDFKREKKLGRVKSIRPYLSPEQISAIEKLQRADIGLLLFEYDRGKRKKLLQEYYEKISR